MKKALIQTLASFIAANSFAATYNLTGPAGSQLMEQFGSGAVSDAPVIRVADTGQSTSKIQQSYHPAGVIIDLNELDEQEVETKSGKTLPGRVDAVGILKNHGITVEQYNTKAMSRDRIMFAIMNKEIYGGYPGIAPDSRVLIQEGGDPVTEMKFTLKFDPPIDEFSFKRPGLHGGESGNWYPEWKVQIFDATSLVEEAGEGKGTQGLRFYDKTKVSADLLKRIQPLCDKEIIPCRDGDLESKPFEFKHPGITQITFTSNGYGGAGLKSVTMYEMKIRRSQPKELTN